MRKTVQVENKDKYEKHINIYRICFYIAILIFVWKNRRKWNYFV